MSIVSRESIEFAPQRPSTIYRDHLKRVIDVVLIILASPLFLPLVIVLAIVTLRDGGSALFGHERVGRGGRVFRCWKIRTMVPDAQDVLGRHLAASPAAAAEWARDCKLSDDPRVTPLGRLLRATSLDELPQLWNVLKGEMSLVGPRPVTRPELARYRGHESHYLAVPPGVTGLWQVSGRNDVSYDERIRLDVLYAEECSFLLDLAILRRTVSTVLRKTGR